MPLQDLMQQHAIHEPSEADSEEERRQSRVPSAAALPLTQSLGSGHGHA
jgi:hypothetical protein